MYRSGDGGMVVAVELRHFAWPDPGWLPRHGNQSRA